MIRIVRKMTFLFRAALAMLAVAHGFQQYPIRHSVAAYSFTSQLPQNCKQSNIIFSAPRSHLIKPCCQMQLSTKSLHQCIRRPTQLYLLGKDADKFTITTKLTSRSTRLSTSECYLASLQQQQQQQQSRHNNTLSTEDELVDGLEGGPTNQQEGITTNNNKIFSKEFWYVITYESFCAHTFGSCCCSLTFLTCFYIM
jgi:hypothetical protein